MSTWKITNYSTLHCTLYIVKTFFLRNLQKFAMPKEKAGRKRKDLVDSTVQQKKKILRFIVVFHNFDKQ